MHVVGFIIRTSVRCLLRWPGNLYSMKEFDLCRKLILLKPEGNQRVGKPKLRRLDSVQEDLNNMGVRNLRSK